MQRILSEVSRAAGLISDGNLVREHFRKNLLKETASLPAMGIQSVS